MFKQSLIPLVALSLVVSPGTASAQQTEDAVSPEEVRRRSAAKRTMWMTTLSILAIGEVLIPDTRYEIDDTSGFQLAWPVGVTPFATERWNFKLGVEPQYSFADETWRFGGWGQVAYYPFISGGEGIGAYTQVGYLGADDGSGPFGSLGLAFGSGNTLLWGVFGRYGSYDGDDRLEFGIDIQVHALWMLLMMADDS